MTSICHLIWKHFLSIYDWAICIGPLALATILWWSIILQIPTCLCSCNNQIVFFHDSLFDCDSDTFSFSELQLPLSRAPSSIPAGKGDTSNDNNYLDVCSHALFAQGYRTVCYLAYYRRPNITSSKPRRTTLVCIWFPCQRGYSSAKYI